MHFIFSIVLLFTFDSTTESDSKSVIQEVESTYRRRFHEKIEKKEITKYNCSIPNLIQSKSTYIKNELIGTAYYTYSNNDSLLKIKYITFMRDSIGNIKPVKGAREDIFVYRIDETSKERYTFSYEISVSGDTIPLRKWWFKYSKGGQLLRIEEIRYSQTSTKYSKSLKNYYYENDTLFSAERYEKGLNEDSLSLYSIENLTYLENGKLDSIIVLFADTSGFAPIRSVGTFMTYDENQYTNSQFRIDDHPNFGLLTYLTEKTLYNNDNQIVWKEFGDGGYERRGNFAYNNNGYVITEFTLKHRIEHKYKYFQ